MYNADFFLYASLHHAADGHPGRVTPQNGPPVLTGMPVSSMILLDRPEEAGYFIFSDLSVRHEGQYYLNFALMEEVKEDRDKDPDEIMSDADEITGPEKASGRSFCFRMTVTTDVFDVFSAKRFPGLQESTALSRAVAEQGCRVRIRRDVRMRRRPAASKNKGDNSTNSGQAENVQKARVEPSQHVRDRSGSNDNSAQYNAEMQRRQSALEYSIPRPSFSGSDSSGGRPHPYSHLPPYAPHGQSLPPSPSYLPSAAHGSQFDPRSSYSSYTDRSPTHQYPPSRTSTRDNYTYRAPRPVLAPKSEADEAAKLNVLPPISHVHEEVTQKRPSFTGPAALPRLLPQLPQHRPISPPRGPGSCSFSSKTLDHPSQLPQPLAGAYGGTAPLTPLTPSPSALSTGSRKRTADDAFLGHGPNGDGSSRHGSYSQPFHGNGDSRRDSYSQIFREYNAGVEASQQGPSNQAYSGQNANGERSLRQCSSSFASSNIASSSIALSSIATSNCASTALSTTSNNGPILPSEYYRAQVSQNEQPRTGGFGAMESDYRVSYPRSEPYIMSTPCYDRASDAPIQVYFPDLHA